MTSQEMTWRKVKCFIPGCGERFLSSSQREDHIDEEHHEYGVVKINNKYYALKRRGDEEDSPFPCPIDRCPLEHAVLAGMEAHLAIVHKVDLCDGHTVMEDVLEVFE